MKQPTLRRTFITAIAALAVGAVASFAQAQTVTMHAATQFNDDHDYNRTLKRFGELVTKYYGKPVEVVIHGNSELGVERDYAKFMNQGISVDVSILAGSNMSNFTKAAPLLDVPFVFRDRAHWNAVIAKNGMKPLFDLIEQQSGMEVIGICGGSTRNIVANRPMRNMKEMQGFKIRVIGAPIQGKIFGAFGAKPSVIAYNEVYNAIQSGVIEGLENEAPAMLNSKFYEVAPDISLTAARGRDPAAGRQRQVDEEVPGRPAGRDPQGRRRGGRVQPRDPGQGRPGRDGQDGRRQAGAHPPVHRARQAARDLASRSSPSSPRKPASRRSSPTCRRSSKPARPAAAPAAAGVAALTSRGEHACASSSISISGCCARSSPRSSARMLVPVTLQVVSRYTDLIPTWLWTEEAARFLLVWMVMLGATIAVRLRGHFDIDLLPEPKTRRGKIFARLAVDVVVAAFGVAFLWISAIYAYDARTEVSEITEMSMALMYVAFPVSAAGWLLFLGEQIVDDLREFARSAP